MREEERKDVGLMGDLFFRVGSAGCLCPDRDELEDQSR